MTLYGLLPAVHRRRDAERGAPLHALLGVVEEMFDSIENDIDRLYDDWFVETCQEWVVPYLADLLGAPRLQPVGAVDASLRAYVANTIAYRRRKGTTAVLEQLAFDVTGWRARAVEFFELLSTTQHLDHLRPGRGGTVDLRDLDGLDRLRHGGSQLARFQGAFDVTARTVDVRRIAAQRGTHNISNLGIWLWRSAAAALTVPVTDDPGGPNRFRISQLALDTPVFNLPRAESSIDTLAGERNVPGPIRRLALRDDLDRATDGESADYYGRERPLEVFDGSARLAATEVRADDLDDWTPSWTASWDPTSATSPVLIDPTTSRLMLPDRFDPAQIRVRSASASPIDVGGGAYDRTEHTESTQGWHRTVGRSPLIDGPVDHTTLAAAVSEWAATIPPPPTASIEIVDDDRYGGVIDIDLPASTHLIVRAANGRRPTLRTTGPLHLRGGAPATVEIDGLLIRGAVDVDGPLTVVLRDSTLVPGHSLRPDGTPVQPDEPSISVVAGHDTRLTLDKVITGPIRMPPQPARVDEAAPLRVIDSIVHAPRRPTGPLPAIAAAADGSTGTEVAIERSTILGSVHVTEIEATGSIFTHRVRAQRTQAGCLRFSFVPRSDPVDESRTPQRFHCEPDMTIEQATDVAAARAAAAGIDFGPAERASLEQRLEASTVPQFVSTICGDPAYLVLAATTAAGIRAGGEGGTEMGVMASVHAPIRLSNLRRALDHYARYGTDVGVLHQT